MIFDAFDIFTGWGKIDNLIPDDDGDPNIDGALKTAGFELFDRLGDPHGTGIEILSRHIEGQGTNFLVTIDTPFYWQAVYCKDLPSCLTLLAQIEPWFRMSRTTDRDCLITEFYELVTRHGQNGPLAECLFQKKLDETRELAERKARAQEAKRREAPQEKPA